jgi:CubicO group peptidase (beta-lactamase class C family)
MIKTNAFDFSPIRPAMQRYVDQQILSGVSSALLVGQDLVYQDCVGWADIENQVALRPDHLFRVFSNTKLVTSIAVLMLMEANKLALDDVIENYLPQLGQRRVLIAGAKNIDDTEPAHSSITIRQLLCHTSGLSYGLLDHGSTMYQAYVEKKALYAYTSLSEMINVLETLPLSFHPGTAWEYSIASDVLGRLVEVISGMAFDQFLQQHIFQPLGMLDTGFVVPVEQQDRLSAYYAGSDPQNALQRPLKRLEKSPYQDAFLKPVARLSGGGGLVSSLPDMLSLLRSLMHSVDQSTSGKGSLLQAGTIAMMMHNQLPSGTGIAFPGVGQVPHKGFGLGGAVTLHPSASDPAGSTGEFEWGGIAGTHWWISPRHQIAGVLMTQRQMGFWHPFSFEFKNLAYTALGVK